MRSIHKFNLTAVLLSATVISTPSPASTLPQTLSEHRDLSAPISLAETDGSTASVAPQLEHRDLLGTIYLPLTDARGGSPLKRRPFASVCFITDAGNCAGLENDEGWNLDNEDRCKEEGYDCTPCPGGSEAVEICPYSGNCHKSCKNTCDSAYNKSCNGNDQQGKGDSCNGLYKECCKLCSDYPYTAASSLPVGYVLGASCNSCSGTKYKAQCGSDYKYSCTYDYTGHISGGEGSSCDGKYKSCRCMSSYTWNAFTGTCDISCDPSYKFDCIKSYSTHISGGEGSACDSKYQRCTCTSPYTWSSINNACTCPSTYKYYCTGTGFSGGYGTSCDGKYYSCSCQSGYIWNAISGTCDINCDSTYKFDCIPNSSTHILGGEGSACGGKYQRCGCEGDYTWNSAANRCELNCSSNYRYDCTYSSSKHISGGAGTPCNGKYISCQCMSGYTWNIYTGTCESECDTSYKYTCTGANQIGGSGSACGGKYTACTCQSGYTWNASSGTCTANSSGPCDGKSNGANGNYYCCNNDVVGVKTSSMNFYVAMKDIGGMNWNNAYTQSQNYSFCGNTKGTLPTKDQLVTIYNNKSSINNLLSANNGSKITSYFWYWSSSYAYTSRHYIVYMSDGDIQSGMDQNINYVRPILSTSSSGGGSPCSGKSNGANGNYYCCNNDVVGVKTSSMNFYVAMKDIGQMAWFSANSSCQSYLFCGNVKGTLPTKDQMLSIYHNKSQVNLLLSTNGGTKITEDIYWSSTNGDEYLYYYAVNMSHGGNDWNYPNTNSYYVRPILSTSSSGGGSTCDSSYKYTCTYSSSTHISGGSGSSCGGKYKSCQCMSGYTWNSYTGTCTSSSSSSSSSSSGGATCASVRVPVRFNTSGVIFKTASFTFPSSGTWYMSGVCGQSVDYVYTTQPSQRINYSIVASNGLTSSGTCTSESGYEYLAGGYRAHCGGISVHCNLPGDPSGWPDCSSASFTITASTSPL